MEKIQLLENSLMELGTEMYRLKSEIKTVTDFNQKLVKTLAGLKAVFDEKGLISSDDFDAASELNEIMMSMTTPPGETLLEKTKKAIH